MRTKNICFTIGILSFLLAFSLPCKAQNYRPGTRLYVSRLSPDVTSSELMDFFEKSGAVDHVKVVFDKVTGKSLCFAYVTFVKKEDAQQAIIDLHEIVFRGLPLNVRTAEAVEHEQLGVGGGGIRGRSLGGGGGGTIRRSRF